MSTREHFFSAGSAGVVAPRARGCTPAAARRSWCDPDIRARRIAGIRAAWTRPERNPLAALTERERADYDLLRRQHRYTRAEALVAIKRPELVRP